MKIESTFPITPVLGVDPGIVASIHICLAELQQSSMDGRNKPAITPEKGRCDRTALCLPSEVFR